MGVNDLMGKWIHLSLCVQFMKATKITNVNFVVNHLLKQEVWRNTSTQFIKATKIINVNFVANHLWLLLYSDYPFQYLDHFPNRIETRVIFPFTTWTIFLSIFKPGSFSVFTTRVIFWPGSFSWLSLLGCQLI